MRRKNYKKRTVQPDPIYNSVLVTKFINLTMQRGKKALAQKIVYTVLENLEKQHKKPALDLFTEILDAVRPTVILKARRVGGANLQIPVPVEREKGLIIGMRWILQAARKRKGEPIIKDLIKEMNDVLSGQGEALKKKEETLKMVESNKAYSHLNK